MDPEASSSSSARQSSLESSATSASHNTMASVSGSSSIRTNHTTSSSQTTSSGEGGGAGLYHRRYQYSHGHRSKQSGGSNVRRVTGDFLSSDDSSHMSVQSQTSLEARERSFGSPSDLPGTLDISESGLALVNSEIALHHFHGFYQSELLPSTSGSSLTTVQEQSTRVDEIEETKQFEQNVRVLLTSQSVTSSHITKTCPSFTLQRKRQDAFAATRHLQNSTRTSITSSIQTAEGVSHPSSHIHQHPRPSPAPKRLGPYDFIRTVGKGNFAVVKLAVHRFVKSNVAIKVMNKDLLGRQNLEKVYREISAMKRLHHPYIVELYQVFETDSKIFMVLEYAAKGEVFDLISSSHAFSERDARELFWQCVCAVHFCHKSGIVHRDLKAENLLLDENGHIKVAGPLLRLANNAITSLIQAGESTLVGQQMVSTTPTMLARVQTLFFKKYLR